MFTQRSATQYFRVSTNFLHADSKCFFWIRVEKFMLSVRLVLEICGIKVVVSFNFALSAPHVKRRFKSCEPPAAAASYSRLTSNYGLRTMDYKSWHKFHCLNKLLSHEHTESHLMPLFYKHQECFECKVHWSFKEIGLKYQSYGFKNIYSKSEQYIRMKCKYVKLRQD